MRMRLVQYSFEELNGLSNPQVAGQPQGITHLLYDTQSYVSAATINLPFFQAVQADKTLGNIEAPGSMPTPKYYAIESIGVDILLRPATSLAVATGPLDDVAQLLFSQRGTIELSYQNKTYGPWPLSAFQASGGPTGFGWGVFAAPLQVQYANNGVPNGEGFGLNQQIILKPNAQFSVILRWAAPVTLAAGNTNIRVWMYGGEYRAVV